MPDEQSRRGSEMSGPSGPTFSAHLMMEDISEKLKLLNYEEEYVMRGHKPIPRWYFAEITSAGEQFFVFSNLLAWLFEVCGVKFEAPSEDDDPNAIVSDIRSEAKNLGINLDFPPARLKMGAGEDVCYVLDQMTNKALEVRRFRWASAQHQVEQEQEEEVETQAHVEEPDEMEDEFDDGYEEEEGVLDVGELGAYGHGPSIENIQKQDELLESNTDTIKWKMEVERVIPSLKVQLKNNIEGSADWRTHLDKMQEFKKNSSENLSSTKSQIDRMYQEIVKTLEKISSREKYINTHLEGQLEDFRQLQDKLTEVTEKYKGSSGTVNELSRVLANVSEDLEMVKSQMEDKGSSMTDAGPLVKIKQALTRVRNELIQMDLRIGVLQHVVLTARVSDKDAIQRDYHADNYFSDMKGF